KVLTASDGAGKEVNTREGDGRAYVYGSEETIFLNSSSLKARSVSVVTLPSEAVASVSRTTTSSLGASVMRTRSYRPSVRYMLFSDPPAFCAALRKLSTRLGLSLIFETPCCV